MWLWQQEIWNGCSVESQKGVLPMNRQRYFTGTMFALYCLLLLWVILFKGSFAFSRLPWFSMERKINFIPFYHPGGMSWLQLREAILNFILFAPFGFYLRMLNILSGKAVVLGFTLSFALELFQLGLAVGCCDVTDILTNTLGTAVGAFFYTKVGNMVSNRNRLYGIVNILTAIALGNLVLLSIPLWLANRG